MDWKGGWFDDFQVIYGRERETRRAKAEGVQKVEGKGEAEKQKRILNVTKILWGNEAGNDGNVTYLVEI